MNIVFTFVSPPTTVQMNLSCSYIKNTAVYYRRKRRTPTRTRKCQLHSIEPTVCLMWSESTFCCPKTPNTNLRLISFLCIFLLRCPLPIKIQNIFWYIVNISYLFICTMKLSQNKFLWLTNKKNKFYRKICHIQLNKFGYSWKNTHFDKQKVSLKC